MKRNKAKHTTTRYACILKPNILNEKTTDDDNNWAHILPIARLMLSFLGSSISQYDPRQQRLRLHKWHGQTYWKSPRGTYRCNPSRLSQRGRTRALCPDRPGPWWSRHVATPARALQNNTTPPALPPPSPKGGRKAGIFLRVLSTQMFHPSYTSWHSSQKLNS